jgi:hypothetical protein
MRTSQKPPDSLIDWFVIQDAGWAEASVEWHDLFRTICVSVLLRRLKPARLAGLLRVSLVWHLLRL